MAGRSPFSATEPPPSDRDLDPATVGRVLSEQLAELDVGSIEHLGSGWERDVFLIDGSLAVHFPRYADVADGLDRHASILDLVATFLGSAVAVPRITFWGTATEHFPHRFYGHDAIPGSGADPLRRPPPLALASELGEALSAIHAILPSAAHEAGIRERPDRCGTALTDLMSQVAVVEGLDEIVPEPYEWLRRRPPAPGPYAGPLRFIHGDLSPDHILVEPGTGRLSGIIDWSGAALGDPTVDLSYLPLLHGREFLDRAMAAYRFPTDRDLVDRITFRARVRALGWLVHAVHRETDPTRALRAVENAFAD